MFSRKLSALNIYKYIACILLGEEKYVQSSRSHFNKVTFIEHFQRKIHTESFRTLLEHTD